jgi:hypothetical protein
MLVGIVYWATWRIFLPRIFGYELTPRKETLQDGTVVTLVSISPTLCLTLEFRIPCVVFTPKGGLDMFPNLSFPEEDFPYAIEY